MDQIVLGDEIISGFTWDLIDGILFSNRNIAFPFIGGDLRIPGDVSIEDVTSDIDF